MVCAWNWLILYPVTDTDIRGTEPLCSATGVDVFVLIRNIMCLFLAYMMYKDYGNIPKQFSVPHKCSFTEYFG
jgi:hypothetical protein